MEQICDIDFFHGYLLIYCQEWIPIMQRSLHTVDTLTADTRMNDD